MENDLEHQGTSKNSMRLQHMKPVWHKIICEEGILNCFIDASYMIPMNQLTTYNKQT